MKGVSQNTISKKVRRIQKQLIGLLHPTGYTDAGYRLYDDTDLERLQHIVLFRELEFPLKDIKAIMNSPDFDSKNQPAFAV